MSETEMNALPIPPRNHKCEAAFTESLLTGIMQRCACGAARYLDQFRPSTPRWECRNIRLNNQARPYRRPLWLALVKKVLR